MLDFIDKSEVLRYLGCKQQPDEKTNALVDECMEEMRRIAAPATVYAYFDLNENMHLENTVLTLAGEDIKKHLSDCRKCVLMAATLGVIVERALAGMQVTDMAKAIVFDACATAAIEQVCDNLCKSIENEIYPMQLTPRFSPGYGDFPLEMQKTFVAVLDAGRKIGLTLTPENIMIPRKSVTAVMGITEEKKKAGSCETCNLKDTCSYRKEGKTCE